jgi:hypothetical protein
MKDKVIVGDTDEDLTVLPNYTAKQGKRFRCHQQTQLSLPVLF